ncbi:DUF3068 domain-containing protein [Actinomadura rugatobispora]|uniref:DUF3068 domain-containing protein n=1 Tax=Actinomadura rugatobispora TaxID=1994 RepID=A0ABW1A9A2_9ACTN|nr:hypothetical protein GCM10010200_005200 [Actinomadura rugatobispora]
MSQGRTRRRSPASSPEPAPARPGRPPGRRGGPGAAAVVVLAVAFFALALAVLLRFFVADRLLVAPTDAYTRAELRANGATYFDRRALKPRTGADLTLTTTVRGNVRASNGDVAVWDTFAVLEDLANGNQIDISQHRMAFDRRTAGLVNCCGATAKPPSGPPVYGTFLPIGVGKRAYQVHDTSTGRAWPMRYEATETIGGLRTYRYTQRIEETRIGEQSGGVPSTLLGLPGPSRTVAADRYYRGTVTAWVEPRTGAIVDRRQRVTSTVRGRDGQGELLAADFDLRMSPETRRALIARAEDSAGTVTLLRTTGPITGLVAGLVLLGLGTVLLVRRRRRDELANEPF